MDRGDAAGAGMEGVATERGLASGWTLARVPPISGGAGLIERLGELLALLVPRAAAILLVADPGIGPAGLIDRATAALRRAGLGVLPFDDFRSDPTTRQTDAAADLARRERAAAVVALGGGSAMDLAKAAAAVAPAAEPAAHYELSAHPFPPRPLLKVCVPTTAGTGSETTRTAVLTDAQGNKLWLWGDALKADLVLLDPALSTGLPPHLTAATGIDALVHAIEAATNRNAHAMSDVFAHEAIRLVVRWLPTAVAEPGDLAARAGMLRAATLAGIAIDNCGTSIAHTIAHALASLRPIHHGRAVGLAMLATLPWNVRAGDPRFAAVAGLMRAPAEAAALPAAFERFLRALGVKVALAGEGHDDVTPERLARQMARPENAPMREANRRPVTDADLLDFARTVLAQS
jgi:alcohol dehydrogenase class IV